MSLIDELNQVLNDLPFNRYQMKRSEIAHFCEHDGICIRFTPARTTWLAQAPCAIKPWWLFLSPLRKNLKINMRGFTQQRHDDTSTTKIKKEDTEVIDNA